MKTLTQFSGYTFFHIQVIWQGAYFDNFTNLGFRHNNVKIMQSSESYDKGNQRLPTVSKVGQRYGMYLPRPNDGLWQLFRNTVKLRCMVSEKNGEPKNIISIQGGSPGSIMRRSLAWKNISGNEFGRLEVRSKLWTSRSTQLFLQDSAKEKINK